MNKENLQPKDEELKAIYDNHKKINKAYERQKQKIRRFNIIIGFVIIPICILIIIYCGYYIKKEQKEIIISEVVGGLTDDKLITFVAKVKRIEIGPNPTDSLDAGFNNTVYIVDHDGHIFYTYFDPELLLLEDGSYIKLHFNMKYYDANCIEIDHYELYGALESQYYQNINNKGE